jgi:DNA polymerase III epsilon subunit-like protein
MKGTTVFFDLETGGVEPHHPNIQVAAIAVRDWKEIDAYEAKVAFDPKACDPEALKVNGYTPEAWLKAVSEAQAASGFAEFCRKHADVTMTSKRTGRPYKVARLAGHNVVAFDVPRARAMMERAGGLFWPACWWYALDTYQRAIWHFAELGGAEPENYQLQTLARYLRIEAQGAAHEALADVRLCARIAQALGPSGSLL